MPAYETTATVEDHGQVHVAGVPFEPGTQVQVTIQLAQEDGSVTTASPAVRTARLFAALDKARNSKPIGRLNREELYDRKVLR